MSLPLLQSVQDQINDKAAYPLTGLAVAPDLVGISLSTTVEFKAGTSVDEKNLALSSAAAAAENYVNNLAVGQTLVVNEIADRIRNADPKILGLEEVNRDIYYVCAVGCQNERGQICKLGIGTSLHTLFSSPRAQGSPPSGLPAAWITSGL